MAVPEVSPPVALLSLQATTKRPSGSAVIVGSSWSSAVVVLIRNSDPERAPLAPNICPRTALKELSPPVSLSSRQTTTNRPSGSAVILG